MSTETDRTYPCCEHCVDDPGFHEDGKRDHHDISCDICDRADDDRGLRAVMHQAWCEGYEASRRGEQKRSPYAPQPAGSSS